MPYLFLVLLLIMPIFSFAMGYFIARNHEIRCRGIRLINGISSITGDISMLLFILSGCAYCLIVGISVVSFFFSLYLSEKRKICILRCEVTLWIFHVRSAYYLVFVYDFQSHRGCFDKSMAAWHAGYCDNFTLFSLESITLKLCWAI